MLVFSLVTDLRASLPSNNFSRSFANNDINYTIPSIVIFTGPKSCAVVSLWNDITLALIYSLMRYTPSVPFCVSPLACPHLFATPRDQSTQVKSDLVLFAKMHEDVPCR
jgi:hypothetical protein